MQLNIMTIDLYALSVRAINLVYSIIVLGHSSKESSESPEIIWQAHNTFSDV